MALNDTLANTLAKIWNAEKVGKRECTVSPSSKIIKSVLKILNDHKYLGEFKEVEDSRGNQLIINLIGKINKCNVIKPRYPVKADGFEKFEKRFLIAKNIGIIIVSTPKGIMTHKEAKEKKLGGKLLAYCY
jgi:small subunit ribosomal protein S8